MYRVPKNNNLRTDLSRWKGHSWTMELHVNSRSCITAITATCMRIDEAGVQYNGAASAFVQPFDDLHRILLELQVDSATMATRGDECEYVEVPLFDS